MARSHERKKEVLSEISNMMGIPIERLRKTVWYKEQDKKKFV